MSLDQVTFDHKLATKISSAPQDLEGEPDQDDEEETIDNSEVPLAVVINRSVDLEVTLASDSGVGITLATSGITLHDGHPLYPECREETYSTYYCHM